MGHFVELGNKVSAARHRGMPTYISQLCTRAVSSVSRVCLLKFCVALLGNVWTCFVVVFAMRGFVVRCALLVACALAVVHGMDGRDGGKHRKGSRKSAGKEVGNMPLSVKAIRARVVACLTMPMSRRAALVCDRDPHVGRHATRTPAVGDRVWAMFASTTRIHRIILPATIAALNYDNDGNVYGVDVTWWHPYSDITHRHPNQVYFRNEVAPGDFPGIGEEYSESYDDIMEERNYQNRIGGMVQEMPSASAAVPQLNQLPMHVPVLAHMPVHVPVQAGMQAGSGDTAEQTRVELLEARRQLAETQGMLTTALANGEGWRLMVQQHQAPPVVLGICSLTDSHFMATGATSRAQGSSSGAQQRAPRHAGLGFSQRPPQAPRPAPVHASLGFSQRPSQAPRPAPVHASLGFSQPPPPVHAGLGFSQPPPPVEESNAAAGAIPHIPVVTFAPPVEGRKTGRIRIPINFYAPAETMDEKPGNWWPGPHPPGGGAAGGAAS